MFFFRTFCSVKTNRVKRKIKGGLFTHNCSLLSTVNKSLDSWKISLERSSWKPGMTSISVGDWDH